MDRLSELACAALLFGSVAILSAVTIALAVGSAGPSACVALALALDSLRRLAR
jgi:hypothetical protein